ncbi:DUF4190 domain-containing protein [Leifsonia aquatica]|uniref:DUF4190 domain-containing protein n=1 Tax=Leifsonia aquatica TaxID=144185 RepID=UPI0038091E38
MTTSQYTGQPEPQPIPASYVPLAPASAPLASHNVFALLSIITVCMNPLLGLVLGHIGLTKIKRTREAGRGLALTAVILGYAAIAAGLLYISFLGVWLGLALGAVGQLANYGSYNY